jgi:hypothetical protein
MNHSHLTNLNNVVEYVELLTGKKLDDRHKNFFADALNVTYGDGYRRSNEVNDGIRISNKFNLSIKQTDLLLQTHTSHMEAMGSQGKEKYSLRNIRKVLWDEKELCLKVYFDDVWWHYCKDGTWY